MKLRHASLLRRCSRRSAIFSSRSIHLCSSISAEFDSLPTSAPDSRPELLASHFDLRRDALSWRVEKLPKGKSVVSAFQSWMGDGNAIRGDDVSQAINRLRRLRMNKRALEVMEWVMRERPYRIKDLDYAHLLEFTIKHHGISSGQDLFSRIPSFHRNEVLYNHLITACLDSGIIRLSLEYMKKMRDLSLPISPFIYNRLIMHYSSPDKRKNIPKIMAQMRADKVPMHTSTFNILLKMDADEHNIEGLSKTFKDMMKSNAEPNDVTYGILAMAHASARLYAAAEVYVQAIEGTKLGENWSTLDVLLILYGCLKKENELERTWKKIRELPHVGAQSYGLAIEAFGRVDLVNKSEDLWKEMKSARKSTSIKEFNSLLAVYCRNRLLGKAVKLLKEMGLAGQQPNAITFRHLALGCLKAGMKSEALKALEMGAQCHVSLRVRKSTPWLETTHLIMEELAELGEVEKVNALFREFKEPRYNRHAFVHNTRMKAHIKAKIYDSTLLNKMILCGARPDAETYSLVRVLEQLKP